MVEKVTCPSCGKEFDLGEGYKKHLKILEAETRAEVEKKSKNKFKNERQKLAVSEAKLKAEQQKIAAQEKKIKSIEKDAKAKADKDAKSHYQALFESKQKARDEDKDNKMEMERKGWKREKEQILKSAEDMIKKKSQDQPAGYGGDQSKQMGEFLKKVFKNTEDKITPYGTGEAGADWLQEIIDKGETVANILYESKRVKKWSREWITKLEKDMQDAKADIGIFFSVALPTEFPKDEIFIQKGNIYISKYDFSVLQILAKAQRMSLINFKKGKVNSKENALSAIKFFDLPEVKTTLSVMISNHLKVVKGLDKIRNATEATIIDNDEIDKNLEKLFKETEKIGAPFNFKKKK